MAAQKGRRAPSPTERETAVRIQRGQNITSVILALIRYGAYGWLGYVGLGAVRALAGKQTDSNILVGILADFGSEGRTVEILMGSALAFLLFLNWRQRKLLRDTISRYGPVRQELERKDDPKRSSSGLPATGETRPEDDP